MLQHELYFPNKQIAANKIVFMVQHFPAFSVLCHAACRYKDCQLEVLLHGLSFQGALTSSAMAGFAEKLLVEVRWVRVMPPAPAISLAHRRALQGHSERFRERSNNPFCMRRSLHPCTLAFHPQRHLCREALHRVRWDCLSVFLWRITRPAGSSLLPSEDVWAPHEF